MCALLCATLTPCAAYGAELSLAQAVQLALTRASAARSLSIDADVQRAQIDAAESEFRLRPSLSGQTTQQRAPNVPAGTASSNLTAAGSFKLPIGTQIEAGTTWTHTRSPEAGTTRPQSRFIQLVQPLLKGRGAAARIALDTTLLSAQVQDVQRQQSLDSLYLAVVFAYYDAVSAAGQVALARNALDRIEQGRRVNQSLVEAGRLARVELLQSEVDVAQGEMSIAQARNSASAAVQSLLQLLGPEFARLDPQSIELTDSVPDPDEAVPVESAAVANALSQRTELRATALLIEAARLGFARAEDDARTQLDLVAGVQSSSAGTPMAAPTDGPTYSIGLKFSVPLDRATLRARKSEAAATLQKAEMAHVDMETLVQAEVRTAVRDLAFVLGQLSSSSKTIAIQQRKLDAELEKLRAGRSSAFQLSAAQDALRQSESARLLARLAVVRARLQLTKATGQLKELREKR